MDIYIFRDGQQMGPYSEAQIKDMLRSGSLISSELAWRNGFSDWQPLKQAFPALFPDPRKEPIPYSRQECLKGIKVLTCIFVFSLLAYIIDSPNGARVEALQKKLAEEEKLESRFSSMATLSQKLEPHGMKPSDTYSMEHSAALAGSRAGKTRAELREEQHNFRWLWMSGIILSIAIICFHGWTIYKNEKLTNKSSYPTRVAAGGPSTENI